MRASQPQSSIKPSLLNRAQSAARLLILISLLMSAATARAQDETPSPTPESAEAQAENSQPSANLPAKSIIRGRVIYEDSNRPVRRARVILLRSDGSGGMDKTGVTNERGEFSIKDVPAGTYFMMVDAPGIITPMGAIDLYDGVSENSALLAVAKEFDRVTVNGTNRAEVLVRARRGGVITGKVSYADGDPAVNAQIIILRKKGDRLARFIMGFSPFTILSMRTDDRGVYRIAGLPPGEYILGATEASMRDDARDDFMNLNVLNNTNLSASYYQNQTSRRQATPIKVEAGQEATEINITLIERATYTLSGLVVARQTRAPVRARLSIQSKAESLNIPFMEAGPSIHTDEQGRWTFTDIPDGTYIITADPVETPTLEESEELMSRQATGQPSTRTTPRRPSLVMRRQEVTVSGGDLTNIVIDVSEGGRISGTLLVEGSDKKLARGLTLLLSSVTRDAAIEKYGFVQDDGQFVIDQVSPGEFHLSVAGAGENLYVKSISAGNIDLLRDTLKIGVGTTVDNVRIVISPEVGVIQGRVVSQTDAKPVSRATVIAVPSDQSRWRFPSSYVMAVTDSEGAFKLSCAPGSYLIIPFGAGDDPRAINEAFIRGRAAGARLVTVQAGGRETLELVAPSGNP